MSLPQDSDFLPLKSSGLGEHNESYDPEDNAKTTISREANQAHSFREHAFSCAFFGEVVILLLWGALLLNSPPDSASEAAFHLWMLKCSLCTVALIAITTSLLNFAIKCYGHHNNRKDLDSKTVEGMATVVGRVLEQAGKSLSNNQ